MPILLIIDDERAIHSLFRQVFSSPEIELIFADNAKAGIELFRTRRPDVVVTDVGLPDISGLELIKRLRHTDAKTPIIVVTGQGTGETAIEAMSFGAYEYLLKPLDLDQLHLYVTKAFTASRLMRVPGVVSSDEHVPESGADMLVGSCRGIQEVYKAIGRVAPHDATVLVLGETGTGKELVARAIYHYSRRSQQPFLAINCAAIPEALLESELFGHEKGAFTGAADRRVGKFEQCNGGTLFLDEIGDMTPLTQTKVLRVLQDQQFEPVGGNDPIRTDVRLIAATNRDLTSMVASGQFRQDLYYRLNVYTLTLPPLRERGDDLALLVDHFLRIYSRQLQKKVLGAAPETLELLRGYSWPGNIRELQGVLKHAVLEATGPLLLPEFLPLVLRGQRTFVSAPASPSKQLTDLDAFVREKLDAGANNLHADWLSAGERRLFTLVMEHTNGNLSRAAKILGLHRTTLRNRLAALGLEHGTP